MKKRKEERERKKKVGIEMGHVEILVGSYLGISTILDLFRREVSLWISAAFGLIGITWHFIFEQAFGDMLGGVLVGGGIILLAFITEEAIGIGDGIALIITGIYLGFWKNLQLCMTGFILSALFSGILLLTKKAKRNQGVPFIPFLLLGYGSMLFLGG